MRHAARLSRRELLRLGVVAAAGSLAAGPRRLLGDTEDRLRLEEATFAELTAAMESGRASAGDLVAAYARQIAELDDGPHGLHAVLELNPEAEAIAAALDAELAAGAARGPLHGIPVLLKDNIETGDRMRTTAGSLALAGAPAARDAFLVTRLRAAGAVVQGKANLSEWANFRSTRSSSGWSAVGGQTRNPYALDRNPCGSSSGSGVAVSANLTAGAVGTETNGSIVCPASTNGVVGVKPTVGLVSRTGVVPISHTQDTAGPMTRTVRDAALLLAGMAGVDPEDPATAAIPAAWRDDPSAALTADLHPGALEGARLGVARDTFGFDDRVDAVIETSLAALTAAGAELVDPVEIPHARDYRDAAYAVLLYEFKAGLESYLRRRPESGVSTLADLIAFNETHASREMPYFGQEIFHEANAKGPLTDEAYLEALDTCRRLSRSEGIDAVLAEHRLDALLAPTRGPAWLTDLVNGDSYTGGFSTAAAVSGYPHVTVPAGFVVGLPVGVSIFGAAWSEPRLLGYAYALEAASPGRRPPRFLPTVELETGSG